MIANNLEKIKAEIIQYFEVGDFERVISTCKKYVNESEESNWFTFFTAFAEAFNEIPFKKELLLFAKNIDSSLFLHLASIMKILESGYFDEDSEKTLVYARVISVIDEREKEYHKTIIPIDSRKALPITKTDNKYVRRLERHLREYIQIIIKNNELKNISERGGAHFAIRQIHNMFIDLDEYFTSQIKQKKKHIKKIRDTDIDLASKLTALIEDDLISFSKSMLRYDLISKLLNWRIILDAKVIQGCSETIPINFTKYDVKSRTQKGRIKK